VRSALGILTSAICDLQSDAPSSDHVRPPTRVTASSVRRLRWPYLGDFADNLRTPLGAEETVMVTRHMQHRQDRFDLKSFRFL
jgi:hypothetical protein